MSTQESSQFGEQESISKADSPRVTNTEGEDWIYNETSISDT